MTPLIVAASMAIRAPSWFCEASPTSSSLASVANCGGVRSPMRAENSARWRWLALRSTKPIWSSSL
jgi:hypothetical protein